MVYDERWKPQYPEKNLSKQSREPTNSIHIWRRVWKLNARHIGGRQVLSPLGQPCHRGWVNSLVSRLYYWEYQGYYRWKPMLSKASVGVLLWLGKTWVSKVNLPISTAGLLMGSCFLWAYFTLLFFIYSLINRRGVIIPEPPASDKYGAVRPVDTAPMVGSVDDERHILALLRF